MALVKSKYIDLSAAPWTMHEFFAGSGLVGYGLKGMFAPIWANDISEQKPPCIPQFGDEHFLLDDIKNINGAEIPYANMSWASFPCQDLSCGIIGRDSRLAQRSCVGMASHPR